MNRLSTFSLLPSLLGITALFSACSPPEKVEVEKKSPNVILIVIDTLRADRLNATRNRLPLMPNLKALAENSVAFTQAYSQETFTKPSVASILTSLYPEVHGVHFGILNPNQMGKGGERESVLQLDVLSPELPSLPTTLKQKGYATLAVQTNIQLHQESGFANGFDRYQFLGEVSANAVTREAADLLEKAKEPFFLYVHYLDPHAPYRPPNEIAQVFGPPPEITEKDTELLRNYRDYYLDVIGYGAGLIAERTTEQLSGNGRELMQYLYDGEVCFTDRQVAALIAAAKKKYPRSIIVVTADHGEEFWEHGSIGHTKTAYRELAHVPLFFNASGLKAKTIETPVELIDIAPTIAACLGIPPPDAWQGRNLLPSMSGHAPLEPKATYTFASGMQPWDRIQWQTVYSQGYRLVMDLNRTKTSLFRVPEDPYEQNSLAEKDPARVADLKKILDSCIVANEKHPLFQKTVAKVESMEESVEALRALGYLK